MLSIKTRKLGNVAILSLRGLIVNGQTEALREAVHSLADVNVIKLDLAQVTTIDAGGLGVLIALQQHAESKNIRLELVSVTRQVIRVLQLTRLDSVFEISSTVEFAPSVSRARRHRVALASCA